MTTFRAIVPDSIKQPANERFEHLLVWLSPNGIVRQWFFSHVKGSESVRLKGFVAENESDIRAIPTEKRKSFKAMTRHLTSSEFDYVRSIMDSNRAYKVLKGGSYIPIAINQDRTRRDNQIKAFEVAVSFSLAEENVLSL